jgi:hypothetical protein
LCGFTSTARRVRRDKVTLEELVDNSKPDEPFSNCPNIRDLMQKDFERVFSKVGDPLAQFHRHPVNSPEPKGALHMVTVEDEETGVVDRQIMDEDGRLFPIDGNCNLWDRSVWTDDLWPVDVPRS